LFAIAGVVLFAAGFMPLFGGPTYEFSLLCGVLLPSLTAVFNAVDSARRAPTAERAFFSGMLSGFAVSAVALAVATIHGMLSGLCDPFGQHAFFLFGPIPGAILGGIWGALCGALCALGTARRVALPLALVLALLGPIAGIAASLGRYYTSPIIFAFDQFFGYFSGTLYDTEIDGLERLLSYRVGTLGWIAVLYAASRVVIRAAAGGLALRWSGKPAALGLGGAGFVVAVGIMIYGPELGHYQTVASIHSELGHLAESERCRVVYARGIAQRDAHALARDCDAHVRQQERYFQIEGPPKVTVYLFASPGQKGRLMGARHVNIAKPWRQEVYLSARSYPHPVLGHEIAHVMAGQFGQGPFAVSGPLAGWIPDPGRIEGVAVAASPREGDDLTLTEWARAMRDLELLPQLTDIFRLGFLGQNSSKAYTVAGAFVHWLAEEHGIDAVEKWYSGVPLETVAGKGLEELQVDFLGSLEKVEVSEQAMAVAKARFDRPGFFGRRCPHQVDSLSRKAQRMLSKLDPPAARKNFEKVLELDPDNFEARAGLGGCAFRERELKQAEDAYDGLLTDERLSATQRAAIHESLGDVAYEAGKLEEAGKQYAAATKLVVNQDRLRALSIKQRVLSKGDAADPSHVAVSELLIGDPMLGRSWPVAAEWLGRWSNEAPKDAIADYLLGKNHFHRGRWARAAQALDRALDRGIDDPLVLAEALRSRMKVACALGQKDAAKAAHERLSKLKGVSLARRRWTDRLAERCGVAEPPDPANDALGTKVPPSKGVD
jgi:tetratricopeptide (TPR) repeat protein